MCLNRSGVGSSIIHISCTITQLSWLARALTDPAIPIAHSLMHLQPAVQRCAVASNKLLTKAKTVESWTGDLVTTMEHVGSKH
jgi:hypothetical protein